MEYMEVLIKILGKNYHFAEMIGAEMDADINAAINILHLGVYSPQNLKAERQ